MKRRNFLSAYFALVVLPLAFPQTSFAESFSGEMPEPMEITLPFRLDVISASFADGAPIQRAEKNDTGIDLADIEPAAGGSSDVGGITLSIAQEKTTKQDTSFKFELAYSPVENVKIRTRRGGLMLTKKFEFSTAPARAPAVQTVEAPVFSQ